MVGDGDLVGKAPEVADDLFGSAGHAVRPSFRFRNPASNCIFSKKSRLTPFPNSMSLAWIIISISLLSGGFHPSIAVGRTCPVRNIR